MNESQRYVSTVDWWRFSLGERKELVYSPTTHSTQIVSQDTLRFLKECQAPKSIEQHAAHICERFNIRAEHVAAMREQLTEYVRVGLLVSHKDLFARTFERSQQNLNESRISSLVIPTRNRPETFERCLKSYAACAKSYGRDELSVHIMDQSDQSATQLRNQEALGDVVKEYGLRCNYWTHRDAELYARRLAEESGVELEVVNFALTNEEGLPQAHGLSRNFLLLKTVGEVVVQVDDDTVCRVRRCPEYSSNLTLTSQYAPQQFWFLTEPETFALGSDFQEEDFFALHEQLLGRSIKSCVSEDVNFSHITSEFFDRLDKGDDRVVATSLGVAGEAGMEGSFYFLAMDDNSRARIMTSETIYRFALQHNQVLRAVDAATISSGAVITGHNQGVDNRDYLPPYFPLWRGEDMTFGELLGAATYGSFNAYLPWHLLHLPMEKRSYSVDHLSMRASRLSFGAISEAIIQNLKADRASVPHRSIESIGRSLIEWGSAPLADFEEMLTQLLLRRASMQLIRFEAELKKFGEQPNYWASDVDMCIKALRKSVVRDNYIVARDLESFYGLEKARIVQQTLFRRFGEVLTAWSHLRDSARKLNELAR